MPLFKKRTKKAPGKHRARSKHSKAKHRAR